VWINCRKCGQLMDDCYTIPDYVCFDCWDEAEANGELYYCSDCGQASVLPFKNDKCEECSSRSARLNRKKKPKIQKAAALIMAMMIALSCLCVSAFAEETTTEGTLEEIEVNGTYMGYDTIFYNAGDSVSNSMLLAYAEGVKSSTSQTVVAFYLMDFDSSGNPHFYSHTQYGYFGYTEIYTDYRRFVGFNGGFSDYYSTDYLEYYATYTYSADGQSYRFKDNDDLTFTDGKTVAFSYTDGVKGFDGFLGDEKYLVIIPCDNSDASTMQNALSQLISGTADDFELSATSSYPAKFHSFASMNDGDVILNMLDWIGAGKQYPIADFSINDNNQYHSYSLRISLNKNYVDTCMSLWEDWRKGVIGATSSYLGGSRILLLMAFYGGTADTFLEDVINIGGFGPVPLLGVTLPTESGTATAIRTVAQYNMLKSLDDLSFVTQYNLTDSHLNFAEGESSVRAYSVCLADYVTIVKGLLYRLDIIDNDTGMILDTAYFCNDSTYAKTNTGYGTKVYNYDSYEDLNNDLENDNGYISNSGKVETDKMQSDNNTDIVVNFDPNELDLGSYMDSLNGLVSDVGSFFTWTWALFPPEIMTIIIIAVGLLAVCGLVKFFVG